MSSPLWQHVASLDDIPLRGSRRLNYGNLTIALFRTAKNQVYALADRCPHKNGPLSEGIIHGNCVTCPLHNWDISLETGEAQGADNGSTEVYKVKLDGDKVLLCISEIETVAIVDQRISCDTANIAL